MASSNNRVCQLCGREMKHGTTEHHLIPRTLHRNKWFLKRYDRAQMNQTISVCRDCHDAIHRFIPSEKDLGRHYASIEALLAHPQLSSFVAWVRKQK